MTKKGQIAVFIVIGIVILIFASLIIYFTTTGEEDQSEQAPSSLDTSSVQSYVDSCLESTLRDAILYTSMQGGYDTAPEDSYDISYFSVPYYHTVDSGDISPAKEKIESEISAYIETGLEQCAGNFSAFTNQGYTISGGEIQAAAAINDMNVIAEVKYPLGIQSGESSATLEDFNAQVDLPIGRMYEISRQYINKQEENPNFVRVTPLLDICANNNLTFETLYDHDTVVFTLIDPSTRAGGNADYSYSFAVKYDWENITGEVVV